MSDNTSTHFYTSLKGNFVSSSKPSKELLIRRERSFFESCVLRGAASGGVDIVGSPLRSIGTASGADNCVGRSFAGRLLLLGSMHPAILLRASSSSFPFLVPELTVLEVAGLQKSIYKSIRFAFCFTLPREHSPPLC